MCSFADILCNLPCSPRKAAISILPISDGGMLEGKGKIYRSGTAYTMFVSVPADVVKDASFPFDRESGNEVIVRIEGKSLVISKT